MSVSSAAGTILGQKFWNGGWIDYRTLPAYAGTNMELYYPYILKFTAPNFSGISTKVEITLRVGVGIGESPTLRWALCDSDENLESYRDTNTEVTDAHQLVSGTVTMENLSTQYMQTLTIPTSGLKSGVTYYLYLWGYAEPSDPEWIEIQMTDYHSVTLYSMEGIIRVKVNGTVVPCAVYCKISGSVKQVIPYVKTASGIKPGS